MATKQRKKQMSDLYIMFDETYDAPIQERASRLNKIAQHYKIALSAVENAYFDFIDSDEFYIERGI
jgi:hypothetical protein